MNFLAHFYLTRGLEEITAGNFIADFVRSSQQHIFSAEINKGIEIHRSIDRFTDEHEIVRQSKQRLYEKYHKYATVIVDVYYDHFLAVNWENYSDVPLAQFSYETYSLLRKQHHVFPSEAQRLFHFMSAYDWLYSYQSMEGIQRALHGLSRRARFNSGMENAIADLKKYYSEFEKEFMLFFPQLQEHINSFLLPPEKSYN
ncbi:MAG TPA: acyl carrier protein phosphodiesterase [Bacteroidia bacterium]|nr:acyl carrier protein phosphodiesterase [Bacteroidia bacterium]